MKNSRPNRLPRTICRLPSGVVSRMSQVRGLASWTIAPAMKIGVRMQIRPTCPKATTEKAPAPLVASCLTVLSPPSRPRSRIAIMTARYPARSNRCRERLEPPAMMRTAIGFVGRRLESQWMTGGMRESESYLDSGLAPPRYSASPRMRTGRRSLPISRGQFGRPNNSGSSNRPSRSRPFAGAASAP